MDMREIINLCEGKVQEDFEFKDEKAEKYHRDTIKKNNLLKEIADKIIDMNESDLGYELWFNDGSYIWFEYDQNKKTDKEMVRINGLKTGLPKGRRLKQQSLGSYSGQDELKVPEKELMAKQLSSIIKKGNVEDYEDLYFWLEDLIDYYRENVQ